MRVQLGDMVEIRGTTRRTDGGRDEREGWNDRSGWVWIAFDGDPHGAFKSEGASFAAAMIGRGRGDLLTFAASDEKTGNQRDYAGGGSQFPSGPWQHYQEMKPLARDVKPVTVFSVQMCPRRRGNRSTTWASIRRRAMRGG